MAKMMDHGSMIWQTLLPQHDGESTVTVRLEDTDGNMLGGKVLAVQVRPKLQERIRRQAGLFAIVGGVSSQFCIVSSLGSPLWLRYNLVQLLSVRFKCDMQVGGV